MKKESRQQKKVAPEKKSRAAEKKSREEKKVAPVKKSRAKGKKVFTINTKEYIPNIMLYVRVYGTNRAPYISPFWKMQLTVESSNVVEHLKVMGI